VDSDNRKRLYDQIATNPGQGYACLVRFLGVGAGACAHHRCSLRSTLPSARRNGTLGA